MNNKKHTIYFIMGGGGHSKQIMMLQSQFSNNYFNKVFVCSKQDKISIERIKKIGKYKVHLVSIPRRPTESIIHALFKNILLFGLLFQIIEAIKIVSKMNKALVITAGASPGALVYIFAYIAGNYCVHVESWSRVKKLSLSAKINNFFTKLFFVQWEEQLVNGKNFIYKGRLL